MSYCNDRNVPFVGIVGESELAENVVSVKNMTTGEQQKLGIGQITDLLSV